MVGFIYKTHKDKIFLPPLIQGIYKNWDQSMQHLYKLLYLILLLNCQTAFAESVRLTIYNDGLSCPANCDAHVVFHHSLNGTQYAHDPSSTSESFAKCKIGSICRLCIEPGGKQCLETIYRGEGPSRMTFDFTPAFYTEVCESTPKQKLLAAKCSELKSAAKQLVGRVNCIASPSANECLAQIESAIAIQLADRKKYDQCMKTGENIYNASQPKMEQRVYKCAYEMHATGGPNSKGITWRKLLPGACREGTFVGRDGLDCCSGNPLKDGPLGPECEAFYPKPNQDNS